MQGNEPFVRPEDIAAVKTAFLEGDANRVINAMAPISLANEWHSQAVPKVVFDRNDDLLYMSRAPLPGNKEMLLQKAWKQVCIYAFSAQHLNAFTLNGGKTPFELIEDIEILRFLELGCRVRMVRVEGGTIAVDYPEDISRAELLARQMD